MQFAFLLLFAANGTLTFLILVRQIILSFTAINRSQVNAFSRAEIVNWPTVTIIVPAHNEARVIQDCLNHVLALDYPEDRKRILIVDDRSTDATAELLRSAQQEAGGKVQVLHRATTAMPGKPAALLDALRLVASDTVVFFDADYRPEPPLLKKLVAPFLDPGVGATMGRVVPDNTDSNLLTRLLDLERRAGYTIDQAARGMWNLLPQFGGTVGAIRVSAMNEVGGWSAGTLAEDTDLTYRLFLGGYSVEYVDDALCFEESPESWPVRFRQVRRWACGHDQCLFRYFVPVLRCRRHSFLKRCDAALVLLFFLVPALALMNLIAALIYPTLYSYPPLNFALLSGAAFLIAFGNFAPYLQIFAAVLRDKQPDAAAAVPLIPVSSAIGMLAAFSGLGLAIRSALLKHQVSWDKTVRYRGTTRAA